MPEQIKQKTANESPDRLRFWPGIALGAGD
jgi:hypothetical protein